ncbi:MAG: cytochrome c [Actinomycetota bacterium]|nr:cytochrome c [Actinomycetota bacterium]
MSVLVLALAASFLATGCGTDTVKVTTTEVASGPAGHGQQLAGESCSSCHGQSFEGVKNLGPALADNHFIRDHTDDELIDFIKEGRSKDDADNETGIAMPAYGGNPRLTDDDLADIVVFLRTLQ